MNRKGGILFLGQKQGEIGGEFIAREAWSGQLIIMIVTIVLMSVARQAEPVQHLELAAGGLLPRERCRVPL